MLYNDNSLKKLDFTPLAGNNLIMLNHTKRQMNISNATLDAHVNMLIVRTNQTLIISQPQ